MLSVMAMQGFSMPPNPRSMADTASASLSPGAEQLALSVFEKQSGGNHADSGWFLWKVGSGKGQIA